ncbi:MAG: hypothetical protein K6B72_00080 [Lachnospiraceae bacterium]|nr:hypothetical protein [Lachnospiraceae bacterium]
MSKPKRRTMRRLKRTLGVTALILALLIALIPEIGEANTYKSDEAGTIKCELIYDPAELGNGLNLYLEEFSGGQYNAVSSGDFRLTVTKETTATNDIPWFANERFRYLFVLTKFDEDGYRDAYHAQEGVPDDGVYDESKLSKDSFYKPYSGIYMFNYKIEFSYTSLFSATTTYYPSVYYYSNNVYSHDASVPSATFVNGMVASPNATFTSTLTNIDHYSYVDVYINSNPEQDIYVDSNYDARYGQGVYFASVNSQLQPSQADAMAMVDAINVSDGLKEMYLPAHKVYLKTTDFDETTYPSATSFGIDEDGGNVQDLGTNYYGADKMKVIAAFTTDLVADLDDSGTADDSMSDTDKQHFGRHQMYIAFPLDGSSLPTRSYDPFVRYSDKIRVLYQTVTGGSGIWYDLGAIDPSMGTGTQTLVVPVTYISDITRMVVLIERAGAVFAAEDHRTPQQNVYQSIIDSNPPYLEDTSASLATNLYVNVDDVASGTIWNNYVAASGVASQAHYNNDDYIRDVEVIKVTSSTNSSQTYSDTTFPTYMLSVGLHEDLNVMLNTAEVHVYHYSIAAGAWTQYDAAGKTGLFVDSGTGRGSIKFEVSDDDLDSTEGNPYGIYVLYYEASKSELSGGSITGRDLRNTDGSTGYSPVNGVTASLDGRMTGGTYYLVVEDKINNLIIANDAEKETRTASFPDGAMYYNIYVGVPQGSSTRYYDDVSSSVSFSDGNGVVVSMTLPSTWSISSTDRNILLVREHNGTITWGYPYDILSGNRIQFISNEFSEYAVFYKEPGTLPDDDQRGTLLVDDSDCFLTAEDYDTEAFSSNPLTSVSWKLELTDPGYNDAQVELLKTKIAEKSATNDGTKYFPFYAALKESTNGTVWYDKDDIGSDTITIYLPVPASTGYTSEDSVTVWGYNASSPSNPQNMRASSVFTRNGGKYVSVRLDSTALRNLNPYTIVYTPAGGASPGPGPSPTPTPAGDEFEFDTFDPSDETESEALAPGTTPVVDLTALGKDKWKATTTIPIEENMELKLLISQYSDADNTQLGQLIRNNSSITAYENGRSVIRVYDVKLKKTTNVGRSNQTVTWPSTPAELGRNTVTISLPYQANLANPNGTYSIWSVDKSGSLENLVAATSAVEGGTGSFTTKHFSQFAILYNPGTASPSGGASTSSGGSTSSATGGSSNSSSASNSASSGKSSSRSSSSASTGASNSSNSGTSSSSGTGSGSGGGGNRASGDGKVDMPHTADATTYKAIFILILLAFGAFELVSSMPAKKKAKVKASGGEKPADTGVHEERIHF